MPTVKSRRGAPADTLGSKLPFLMLGALAGLFVVMLVTGPVYDWMRSHFEFMRYHPVVVMDDQPVVRLSPAADAAAASSAQDH
jgi:hypothetical protein